MSETPKKKAAYAWSEQRWYVECPNCEISVDLGSDTYWQEGEEWGCEHCETDFILPKQEE